MNDNWIEIVDTLKPYIYNNSTEVKYQQEIENCLKFLGWRSSNKTMQSQVSINIGNRNSLRPDIILFKENKPVLPIEIKRPCNTCKGSQKSQLQSYMRQLRLNIGLYVGENMQLYYDNPDDLDDPICVFVAELDKENKNGIVLCDLLSYGRFEINKIEEFCKEHYNQIIARNNFQQRFRDFFSDDDANKNILSLLKEKFIKEGFDADVVENELSKLSIVTNWNNNINNTSLSSPSNAPKDNPNTANTQYSFDGVRYYNKRRFVIELIKYYVSTNEGITFNDLQTEFPPEIHSKALGVVQTLQSVRERISSQPDIEKRYFLNENDIIRLDDNTQVVVTNQWDYHHFPAFLSNARKLYQIHCGLNKTNCPTTVLLTQNNTNTKKPTTKLRLVINDNDIIMEDTSVSTFISFIEKVGTSKVASLGLYGRKETLLLSNEISNEYHMFQHAVSNGYYLFSNYSTMNLKKLIENIADRLSIRVNVEIIEK